MSLHKLQREFILMFVSDGEYDLMTTCSAVGVLPSEALGWFRSDEFQGAIRKYEGAQMAAMGYGPLRVIRDTLAIAHSDIGDIQAIGGDLSTLPRHVRVAIRKVKFKAATTMGGEVVTYPAEIEMHSKEWALKQAAEWFTVQDAPEVKKAAATDAEDGPKRIAGLIVRPPLSKDERDLEDLLS